MTRERILNAISGCCINDRSANEATDRLMRLFNVGNINLIPDDRMGYEYVLLECKRLLAPYVKFSIKHVVGISKKSDLVFQRSLICYLLHKKGYGKKVIGDILGGRNHATVIHLLRYDTETYGHDTSYPEVILEINKAFFKNK